MNQDSINFLEKKLNKIIDRFGRFGRKEDEVEFIESILRDLKRGNTLYQVYSTTTDWNKMRFISIFENYKSHDMDLIHNEKLNYEKKNAYYRIKQMFNRFEDGEQIKLYKENNYWYASFCNYLHRIDEVWIHEIINLIHNKYILNLDINKTEIENKLKYVYENILVFEKVEE